MNPISNDNMLSIDDLDEVRGGCYSGSHRTEALQFLKEHMDGKTYELIMSKKDGRQRPYVAAKIFLSSSDWEKYVWIEKHGTLDGFPG